MRLRRGLATQSAAGIEVSLRPALAGCADLLQPGSTSLLAPRSTLHRVAEAGFHVSGSSGGFASSESSFFKVRGLRLAR